MSAKKNNPHRWFVQPFLDSTIASKATWYHPNPTGWYQEARVLVHDSRVPKLGARSEPTYFYNKRQGWLVRPRTLDFCSTGCEYDGLSWRGWDTRITTGKGFFAPKTSDPRVNGRWPVVIKLSRRRRCPNHRLIYTRYKETLTGKLPPWDPPRVTRINWGCDGTHNGQY